MKRRIFILLAAVIWAANAIYAAEMKTVYFSDKNNWGTDVYAYAWTDDTKHLGDWPGTKMTWVETNYLGEQVYKIDIPVSAANVIFNNNGGGQTGDLNATEIKHGWGLSWDTSTGTPSHYAYVHYNITTAVLPIAGGTVSGAGSHGISCDIVLTATANEGYVFANWTNAANEVVGTNPTLTITVTADAMYTANFMQPTYVDLGLSSGTLWATCNVGATAPEQYGGYYAWGETETQSKYIFSQETYAWTVGASNILLKYCNDAAQGHEGYTDDLITLEAADDAATANWGVDWRMPTIDEQQELLNECKWTWTTHNGVNGYLVVSKTNGNAIFLPAAGYYQNGGGLKRSGSQGFYWSSSLSLNVANNSSMRADAIFIKPDTFGGRDYWRESGHSVRPVQTPKYTITVTDSEGGTATGGGIYIGKGTTVLTAIPNAWYAFAGWSDGNMDNPRTITIAADATYTAKFVKRDMSDNLVTNGDVSDGNTGWTIEGDIQYSAGMLETSYKEGKITQEIDLQAKGFTPDELDDNPQLYVGGDVMVPDYNRGREGLVKIVVRCLDASRNTLSTITLRDDNPITVGNPWTTYYQLVTLPQATRYLSFDLAGKDISYWGGYYGPKFDNLVARLYRATMPVHNISVVRNISVCRAGISGYYPEGSEVTLSATPEGGCVFVNWTDATDAVVGTETELTVTATSDATYSANFKPVITVEQDKKMSDLEWGQANKDLTLCDIIVTNGATLTCDADKTVANVRVEDGGKLVVKDAQLTITGVFTAHSQDDVQPQILTTGTGAITYGTFQFLKRIPADRYYFFSLPFECATSSVTVDDGVAAKYNTDWNIRYYDGAGFAANPSNKSFWMVDNTGTIQPNQGYTIGVATAVAGQYRELAFTASGAVDFSLNTNKTIPVAANGATGTEGEKYKGWNFIMNPYTSNLNGVADGLKISSNALAYVTIPDAGQNKTYTTKLFSEAGDLPPFFGFFVQVAEAGDVVFNLVTRMTAPAVSRTSHTTPLLVGIRLSNGVIEDETTLVIGEQFTEAYEIGSDLMKMIGYADKPQLYTFDAETKYAFHSLNEAAVAKAQPLGVYLPTAGEYTFSLKPIRGEREVKAVYLYDYETSACVDLMQEDYTFTSGMLNTEERFALSPMFAPKQTTAIDSNTAADLSVWQSGALQVCVEGIATGDRVRIFDIQGRLVSEWTATDTVNVGDVPASGMYVVECMGAARVQVVRLIIKN